MPDDLRKVLNEIISANNEITRRLDKLEAREYSLIKSCTPTDILGGATFTAATTYTSADVTTALSIPSYARGVIGSFFITPINSSTQIYFAASPATPAAGDQLYYWYCGGADTERELLTQTLLLFLGTDGKFTAQSTQTVAAYLNVFAYWL